MSCRARTPSIFTVTPTPATYTLFLHDALPISHAAHADTKGRHGTEYRRFGLRRADRAQGSLHWAGRRLRDRKSTRLNSSHANISYAVFCLQKKKLVLPVS